MAELVMTGDGRMNTKNAAQYLGYSIYTLTIWRSQGKGPSYVKQGGISYYKQDLDQWMKQGRVETADAA